jgi:hypothetical protein
MARIFLSYRREDAQGEAGHLVAELRQRYGAASVFMDISAIEPGADFPQTIERAMLGCEVVLVLIGKGWLDARDAYGRRRLDDPKDWVRLEVELALEGKRRVIPVRVQGAQMPAEEALPESMRPLARLNAHEISARRWDYDFQTLASLLDRLLPDLVPARAADDSKPPIRSSRKLWVAGVLATGLLLGVSATFLWREKQFSPTDSRLSEKIGADREARRVTQDSAASLTTAEPTQLTMPKLAGNYSLIRATDMRSVRGGLTIAAESDSVGRAKVEVPLLGFNADKRDLAPGESVAYWKDDGVPIALIGNRLEMRLADTAALWRDLQFTGSHLVLSWETPAGKKYEWIFEKSARR